MRANESQLKEFINYAGLYRDEKIPGENYVFCETIESRSKDFNWNVSPHLHSSLYQLMWAEKGSITLFTSDDQITFEAPFIIFIPPLNIHGFHYSPHVQGHILTFSDFYTQTLQQKYPNVLQPLEKVFWILNNSYPVEYQQLSDTLNAILTEYESLNKDKGMLLEYQLYLLVLHVYRFSSNHSISFTEKNTSLAYFKKFQQLIKTSESPFTSLQEYAAHLHITTRHLNSICRTITQMSALQVVQTELISKAKAYLYHFNSNISQVAYDLGFDDPSYFTRLFKKHTGLTPVEFRKKSYKEQ